jgi:hypothetical protein
MAIPVPFLLSVAWLLTKSYNRISMFLTNGATCNVFKGS